MCEACGGSSRTTNGLRIPNMLDAAVEVRSRASTLQGEDILPIRHPDTKHVRAPASPRLNAWSCRDLFLNETAISAHIFLPGSKFLEKDGTSQTRSGVSSACAGDASRSPARLIGRSRSTSPRRWGSRQYEHHVAGNGRVALITPTFAGVSFGRIGRDRVDSSGPCNEKAQAGTTSHALTPSFEDKRKFVSPNTSPCEAHRTAIPLLMTTASHPHQLMFGAQTRRTPTSSGRSLLLSDRLEIILRPPSKTRHPRRDWVL